MAEHIVQSTAKRVAFKAYLASDSKTPATGKTIAMTISKNCAAYGNPSGGATNATEIGSGSYYVDLSTTDTGTLGPLLVKGTEGTIDQVDYAYEVEVGVNVATVLGEAPASETTIAEAILITPSNKLATDTGGVVTVGVNTDKTGYTLDLTTTLSSARNVGSVSDTALTYNDVFHCAVAAAAGKETVSGTTYTVKTPSTGTTLRSFTLDSSSLPTSRT